MSDQRVEFFFDPICPFCWVTAQWVRGVAAQRPLRVRWRPLALKVLNEPIGYEGKPAAYPEAHERGLEMLRVVAAARAEHGEDVVGELYRALGEAVWNVAPPEEASFEAVLASTAAPRDLMAALDAAGLPRGLADAAHDPAWDTGLRSETEEAVQRAGGGVGTPILSFDPPDGPALFGPVIDRAPDEAEAVRLWDAVETLARWPGFAELKRSLRNFPDTPLSSRIAGRDTQVR
ncbi:DsbA family protein [Saccharopolyspora halophila]|uniref:DsbA family protein n=1 Tax=Saccharopolyspora halophila TaxID=405551 RepID=A0ABN3GTS2_9PSEU